MLVYDKTVTFDQFKHQLIKSLLLFGEYKIDSLNTDLHTNISQNIVSFESHTFAERAKEIIVSKIQNAFDDNLFELADFEFLFKQLMILNLSNISIFESLNDRKIHTEQLVEEILTRNDRKLVTAYTYP